MIIVLCDSVDICFLFIIIIIYLINYDGKSPNLCIQNTKKRENNYY